MEKLELITSTKEADTILKEARVEAEVIKDKILQAKERFIELNLNTKKNPAREKKFPILKKSWTKSLSSVRDR